MVLTEMISFGVGLYSGVYIAQNYEMPAKDERKEIYEDLKAIWKQKMADRKVCFKGDNFGSNDAKSTGSIQQESSPPISSTTNTTSVNNPQTFRQILEKYKKKNISQ